MSVNRKIIVELYPVTKGVDSALKGVDAGVKELSRSVQAQNQRMQQAFERVTKSIGQAARRLAAGLSLAMGAGVKVAADFEEAMRNVNAIAQQSEADFAKTTKAVLNLNREIGTAQSPRTMAAAMTDIAGAGFNAQDSLLILKEAATGADAGMTTAAVAADGLTTTLAAFSRPASESAKVMDVMFKTVDVGKIEFDELASNIGKTATFANSAGVSMEELHAGIAMLSVRGLAAEENVVALRGAIKGILDPSKEAKDLLEELGLEYGQTALQTKGLIRLLQDMEKATGGDTAIMSTLLGDVRGLNAALGLLSNDGGAQALDFLAQMQNADGSKMLALEQQSMSLNFQIRRLRSTVEALVIQVSTAFLPAIKQVVEVVASWVNALSSLSDEQKTMIAHVTATVTAISALVGVLSGVVVYLAGMKTALAAIGITGFAAATKAAIAVLAPLAPAILAVTAAVVAMAAAWQTNLGDIQGRVREWSREIRSAMSEVTRDLTAAWTEVRAVTEQVWSVIGPFVRAALSNLRQQIETFGSSIVDLWGVSWELISGTCEVAWELITGVTRTAFESIRTIMETGSALMRGDWEAALASLVEGTKKTAVALKDLFLNVLEEIGELISSAGSELYNAGVNLANRLAEGAKQGLQNFKAAFAEAMGFGVDQGVMFGEASDRQFRSAYATILEHTKSFGDSFRAEIEKAFAPLKNLGDRVSESLDGVRDAFINSGPGQALASFSSIFGNRAGATGSSATGGDSGSGGGASNKTNQQLISEIRKLATVNANVSFEGASNELLEAIKKWAQNAYNDGVPGVISSVTDGRHAPNSYHYDGAAMDFGYYRPGGGTFDEATELALAQKHLRGTGFQGGINEIPGNSPHIHAAMGTGDRGHSGYFDIETGYQETVKKINEERLNAEAEHLAQVEAAHDAHREYLLAADTEYNQARAAEQAKFAEVQRAYLEGAISEDMFGEALLAYQAQLGELHAAQIEQTDAMILKEEEKALAIVDLAIATTEQTAQIAAEEQARIEEYHQAVIQSQIAEYEHQVAMDQMTYQQRVVFLQQMLAQENLTMAQKRNLEVSLHNLRKAHDQERTKSQQEVFESFTSTFENFLVQTMSGQAKFSDATKNLWKSLLNTIITHIAKAIAKAIILKGIMSSLGGFFGIFHDGGIVGPGNGLLTAHTGGVITPNGLASFHSGGMVTQGGIFPGANLRPDEIVAKLQTGEAVLPRSLVNQLRGGGASSNQGRATSINVGAVHMHNGTDINELTRALAWRNYAYAQGG